MDVVGHNNAIQNFFTLSDDFIEQRNSPRPPSQHSRNVSWTKISSAELGVEATTETEPTSSAPSSLEPLSPENLIEKTPNRKTSTGPRLPLRFQKMRTSIPHESQSVASDVSLKDAKERLRSMWNNMKYKYDGWSTQTNFEQESPIWLLGKLYHSKLHAKALPNVLPTDGRELLDITDFKGDFMSRIWFTYRRGFEKFEGSEKQTDTGWGCMLRSGQMMLAQALVLHRLGRDWSMFCPQSPDVLRAHRQIINYFGDRPDCPLSLHRLLALGQNLHSKSVGEWYGPASVALLLRDALRNGVAQDDPVLSQIQLCIARDCVVSLEEIDILCGADDSDLNNSWSKSLVLVVPLRLGTDKVNGVYVHHIKMLFSLPNCLGIIGGKPKHSLYFVGCQGNSLIYLDPHKCRDTIDTSNEFFPLKSFHSDEPRKLHFADMDPSCAVGFYCRNRSHLYELLKDLESIIEHDPVPGGSKKNPLFSVVDSIQRITFYDDPTLGPTFKKSDTQSVESMNGFVIVDKM